ncbi:MAG: YkvA family protein [Nitrospinota bacterium]|nr:YkvA family protein [Nitrospinota bacterium]
MDENGGQPISAPQAKRRWVAILVLLAAIIYGIMPIDAIPDVIPILGLGDDALVILGSLIYFYKNFIKTQPPGPAQGD